MNPVRLADLVKIFSGHKEDIRGDADKIINCAMPFDQAGADAVTFADNAVMCRKIPHSRAGAVIVPKQFSGSVEVPVILSDNPRLAFARVLQYFYPQSSPFAGISPGASIGNDFVCGTNTAVAPLAFIGDNVSIGDRSVIYPHVFIGNNVKIGDDTVVYPNVSVLENCVIGSRVIIGAATVIGADGFGFTPDEAGRHVKIPQTGIVAIDDDVEIGASNTIDRATFGQTRICQGVKTDNQVHIGHNVTIGKHSIIVAQVGIAGSTTIGAHVIVAGQAGIGGHLKIGDRVVIGPQAGVARNVDSGQTVSGTPEMPHGRWLRAQQVVSRLPEMKKQVADMRRRIEALEKNLTDLKAKK
jgi:UDP-3-O-[3-hydroxymyristoyl] glucosamine N-acyltransferase